MLKSLAVVTAAVLTFTAHAATPDPLPAAGTLVLIPANGEVSHVNDQAVIFLGTEEINKDKALAASRVNQKIKQGLEIVKRQDPQASLKTVRYYTTPVYSEQSDSKNGQPRIPTAWRVGQLLQVTTTNLAALPKTVAAAQAMLALSHLRFELSPATQRKLDDQRIAATYHNLNERIRAVASAMGRQSTDAVLEVLDFEGAGNVGGGRLTVAHASNVLPSAKALTEVEEPSFEPGETILQMRAVGKVRFK